MRNAIVTVGSRGLGLGISQNLVAAGFRVIAVARKESAELTAAMLKANEAVAGSLNFEAFDLSEIDGIATLVKKYASSMALSMAL